jgi:hypothetical protein
MFTRNVKKIGEKKTNLNASKYEELNFKKSKDFKSF